MSTCYSYNGDRAAFPITFGSRDGLTKREYFAAVALQGLLADSENRTDDRKEGETCCQATARLAVEHADCLINALKK